MPKLFQINECLTGSTGSIAQNIGEKAIADGWESWIAYSSRNLESKSRSHLIPIGSKFESQLHAIDTRLFDRHGLGSRRATKQFIETIENINPDVIHLHNIHGYYLNIEILFDFLCRVQIPVVWTLHDCWAFTGHCVHYTDVNCNKWRNDSLVHCCDCPKKSSYPASLFFDRSSSNYSLKQRLFTSVGNMTIVPVSHWLGSVVADSFLGKYPIKVIQNGINTNTFYPRPNAVSGVRKKYNLGEKFIILGVAKGWSEDVGLHDFYWLRKNLPQEDYAIVMVGLTPKQISSLPEGITGITHTWDANELAEIYTSADMFFNGSFQETFGLVTAESMACGTPVIVYNETACPEIVQNQKTGFIFEKGDRNGILNKIVELSHSQPRSFICEECASFVKNNLNKENKYKEYIKLYNSLI